ncbi:c-type cytochrome [Bordetella hinzii]|uniref:Cytochrome C n=1 Tax=Bordetella hinzii TaxID=103855 RepID=A0AAN1RYB0_9BORD|nr:c-type cytochrome [Bordetella hinzii]AKQ57041.1 Cytochrome c4 [Bordetella hinzii]AKQ61507.1 Cytochrome c4 [Bordetella hinzii]AZW17527.1 cytochrome C [Bordetella hinzii]KCB28238.1 cytochrome C [Bordetella hinzii L60]KCB33064.1 cytochrome C [Bordetella hinzii CA90 BAL1384]
MKTARRVEDIDPAFDPWEQSRPIPLFVLAIFIALAIWGALSYLDDLAPARSGEPGGLTADAPTPVQADAGAPLLVSRGNASLWSCASCHGARGEGAAQTPRLAGLPAEYLAKQLRDFAAGARANESMRYIARQLSDADIETVARYYAGLPPLPGAAMALGASQARGEMLNRHGDWKRDIPACATCHGQNGEGVGSEFPRLAGQQAEYLLSQLAAWKGGQRRNSPQSLMDDIAARMSDDDMRAAAQYFGSLRP